jgi:catechol 2,3-dioxygenase-like lactoylglutathione lyase family enzyme
MLSHLSLGIHDLERSQAFYDAVLGALGYARVWTGARGLGYGSPGREQLNLFVQEEARVTAGPGFHLAFAAPTPAAVDAFHAAALAHGGHDLGEPGLRPHYGPTYYAAFVLDPDGHKLEAVHQ